MTEDRIRTPFEIRDDIDYAVRYLTRNAEKENWGRVRYWSNRIERLREELAVSYQHKRDVHAQLHRPW